VLVGVGETDGAATGPVDEPVGVGEPDGGVDELGLGVEVVVGEADGDVVADGEAEGVADGVDGVALWAWAELPWAGATRFGG
jgi:hypothetical protein